MIDSDESGTGMCVGGSVGCDVDAAAVEDEEEEEGDDDDEEEEEEDEDEDAGKKGCVTPLRAVGELNGLSTSSQTGDWFSFEPLMVAALERTAECIPA